MSVVALCVLSSLTCVLLAKPKALTQKQKQDKEVCDNLYTICANACPPMDGAYSPETTIHEQCGNDCINELTACYGKIGIQASPETRLPNGVTVHQLQTASPAPKGGPTCRRAVHQASPTATPSRATYLPQGTLTQASPTPTPTAREKKKN